MHIILLSGGSGKRLWPLSNDIRSKQFIKLFKNSDGSFESMLNRVYNQIKHVDKDINITVATSETQVPAIRNQLGDKVSISIEPCRRDTFPAIALSCAYLHDILNISDDEVVAVCPVDPYVEDSYYKSVKKLENIVNKHTANLTLMGIKPTYPSEKYGYIIPKEENADGITIVKEFKEKPDTETAKMYLLQGALWNAGVFAFKLGWLMDKAHQLINFSDYNDLYKNFAIAPKISFDYAVVEKEPSIQMLQYNGEWKDVGTWNTMTEVMSEKVVGNAFIDEKCINTNVINELNIPLLAMGCKDLIIAASNDGILVSDKELSDYMKPYVEKISGQPKVADKIWGSYKVIDFTKLENGTQILTSNLVIKSGSQFSYHSHALRSETWVITNGQGSVVLDGIEKTVKAGDSITIKAGVKHTLKAVTDMTVIEVQSGKEISSQDKKLVTNE
ncbi:sugar phosphate nucleotidyltransferase [uncultured Treponema sp.]|uniref:sugar phosphate nucleotidyltransferase n=1 Tax=uncultured Treponema sp. TaxID=162155 RepID=UPI0025833892|nr:sugar phosphate nucleotidyltransferase [uncultured Treponema sp.]